METRQNGGNALFMILIAIFLLGAVTALIARTNGTSEETGSTEKLSIEASNVLRYSASIQAAVQQMLMRGCSESQISFVASQAVEDYVNPNAPADESCHLFSTKGAGIAYKSVKPGLFIGTHPNAYNGRPIFYSGSSALGGGTNQTDLMFMYNDLTKNMCMTINNILGISNPSGDAPTETVEANMVPLFKGTYGAVITDPINDNSALAQKKAGCVKRTDSSNMYQFYQVLIFR